MKTILSLLILTSLLPKAAFAEQEPSTIAQFQGRMNSVYKQFDESAKTKQVVVGTLEAIMATGLNKFVTKPDVKAMDTVMKDLTLSLKLPTTEDYQNQIDEVQANQANYIELVQDNNGKIAVTDMKLRDSVMRNIQTLQSRIDRQKVSTHLTDKMKDHIVSDLQEQIERLVADKNNYVDASKVTRNSTIVGRQLKPLVAGHLDYLNARQLVAMTSKQKEAKIQSLTQKLEELAGRTFKGRMVRATNVLVRAGQVALVLDIGYRIYVITTLNGDPSLFPMGNLVCRAVDCHSDINIFLERSSNLYGKI